MIAISLGLLIVAALSVLFVNTSRTNREMAKANKQIENGRFAIQILENDIVHAGFWGTHAPQFDDLAWVGNPVAQAPTDVPTVVPEIYATYNPPNWTPDYKNAIVGIPVQAYEAAPGCDAAVATGGCGAERVLSKQGNTDVLVVRHGATCAVGEAGCEADVNGKLYFQASQCEFEIDPVKNTCAGSALPATDAVPFKIDTSGFTLKRRNCTCATGVTSGTFAPKRRLVSNLYYIRDHAITPGDGIPTLMRSTFDLVGGTLAHQPAEALVEGIDGFRVEFGVDNVSKTGAAVNYAQETKWANPNNKVTPINRGDGAPDGDFVRCTTATPCTAAQLMNVTAVKVYVLARSLETSPDYTDTKTYALGSTTLGPFNDKFKRHVFSTTVRINNVAGRRETP
jgi:type IV pilus assembly protein PilW